MLKIPESVVASFGSFLTDRNIPATSHGYYKKWFRYYLDYCHKYRFYYLNSDSLPNFLNKLKEKNRPEYNKNKPMNRYICFMNWQVNSLTLKRS
ncbi:MAG: hypothetical protein J7K35_00635 [Syntrophobacterales bacterium]|nr:hypothetical protein [Syntrophobacterales bacterium]